MKLLVSSAGAVSLPLVSNKPNLDTADFCLPLPNKNCRFKRKQRCSSECLNENLLHKPKQRFTYALGILFVLLSANGIVRLGGKRGRRRGPLQELPKKFVPLFSLKHIISFRLARIFFPWTSHASVEHVAVAERKRYPNVPFARVVSNHQTSRKSDPSELLDVATGSPCYLLLSNVQCSSLLIA